MATYSDPVLEEWRLGEMMDDVLYELGRTTGNDDELTEHERETIRELVQRRYEALKARETPDFHQAIGAIPLQEGMPTATEAIRQAREEG